MQYVYHTVPPAQVGEVLVPLNQLRALSPGLWHLEVAKDAGRERVLDYRIPTLGVLWNDTIHLAPIQPLLTRRSTEVSWVVVAAVGSGVVPHPARPTGRIAISVVRE